MFVHDLQGVASIKSVLILVLGLTSLKEVMLGITEGDRDLFADSYKECLLLLCVLYFFCVSSQARVEPATSGIQRSASPAP